MRGVLAVVPIQHLQRAKSRLASRLPVTARQRLVLGLVERTVATLQRAPSVSSLYVVTPDASVARVAARAGARVLYFPEPGLAPAVEYAQRVAVRSGAAALLVVLGDLPFLTPSTVERAVALLDSPGLVLAPDRHGTGTNLLALAPPDIIRPAFGPDSRGRHHRAARAARCTLRELWAFSTACDLDTPTDYELVQARLPREGELWHLLGRP